MSGGGGGKGFCGWGWAGDAFVSSCSEQDCFLGGGKKGMKIFGGGVWKEESLELKYSSVFLPLLAALLLALGLGFNLNSGVLILDGLLFLFLESFEAKEADIFLSTLVVTMLVGSRDDVLGSCNLSSILDSSSREKERPVDGKVRARSTIAMSPARRLRLFLFLLLLENIILLSAI